MTPRVDILPYSPEHIARVADSEVSHAPWLVGHRLDHRAVLRDNELILNVRPPSIHVLDKKVHHKIVDAAWKLLQQKARGSVSNVREAFGRPSNGKPRS